MNKQEIKQQASVVADTIVQKGKIKPEKLDVNFIGVQKNEKGHFHSVVFEVDMVIAGNGGKINTLKTVQLPLNYLEDMVIDAVEKEKADAKAQAEKAKAEADKAKADKEAGKKAFDEAQKNKPADAVAKPVMPQGIKPNDQKL